MKNNGLWGAAAPLRMGAGLLGALLLASGSTEVLAQPQPYPGRPVRVIVPYPPGGVVDILIRKVSQQVSESMGKPLIVENRPGANTIIALTACARAAADGYTFCASSGDGMSFNPYLYQRLSYNAETDFAPVTQLVWVNSVIVANAKVPFETVRGMIDYAKTKPGELNFASFGTGSTPHLFAEWFRKEGGANIVHVPYKGSAETMPAVMSGEAHATFVALGLAMPLIKSGKLKALAVTSAQRVPQLPDVSTLQEQQIDPNIRNWFGIFAPAGTPAPIVQRMGAEFAKAVRDPAMQQDFLKVQGYDPVGSTPAEFAALLVADRAQARRIVSITGIQLEGGSPDAAKAVP